ncbi:MAG: hypothetical protein F6K50_02485 [Moorea sp. SIO3I7]|uniref:hypothetical protein n=1 Tax=unclassified Moorena TaxID=2683338 RepID=UPI0013BF0679|nr:MULTISPECIES: hypothetical protein [unclassified Moorena]NEN94431.1 hypothetical protein [Moorena sp. SIO3I7]NEO04432.1 hypothetical protein [Moorena sp. SIO3I8]NEO22738.1 hypothetical protein [Moorena sp. SIO4A5]NEQ58141.1 hypothetical protein [Moorena sp. SIO4A1]
MGLDRHGTKFLLYAKSQGVDFDHTATIGRQGLHLDSCELKNNFSLFGQEVFEKYLQEIFQKHGG